MPNAFLRRKATLSALIGALCGSLLAIAVSMNGPVARVRNPTLLASLRRQAEDSGLEIDRRRNDALEILAYAYGRHPEQNIREVPIEDVLVWARTTGYGELAEVRTVSAALREIEAGVSGTATNRADLVRGLWVLLANGRALDEPDRLALEATAEELMRQPPERGRRTSDERRSLRTRLTLLTSTRPVPPGLCSSAAAFRKGFDRLGIKAPRC